MADLKNMNAEQREEFCSHVREAAFHLASCWDALREAENLTEDEIETDEIDGLTSSIGDPSGAYDIHEQDIFVALWGGDDGGKYECQNCYKLWLEDSLKPVENLTERVEPGEPMPAGECPACGAVCHEVKASV